MKWFLIVVVLLVPVSAQATMIADKFDSYSKEKGFWIVLNSEEDENYLNASFRFFIPREYSGDPVPKGKCSVTVGYQINQHMDDITIFGEYGRELWFPSLAKENLIILNIVWENGDPHVEYISAEVKRKDGNQSEIWKSEEAEKFFTKEREAERAEHYREFSLDDVCHFYMDKDQST